jgi:hypothetical protein
MHLMMTSLLLTGGRLPAAPTAAQMDRRARVDRAEEQCHRWRRMICSEFDARIQQRNSEGKIPVRNSPIANEASERIFLSTRPVENLVDNPAQHRATKGKSLSGQ